MHCRVRNQRLPYRTAEIGLIAEAGRTDLEGYQLALKATTANAILYRLAHREQHSNRKNCDPYHSSIVHGLPWLHWERLQNRLGESRAFTEGGLT